MDDLPFELLLAPLRYDVLCCQAAFRHELCVGNPLS